jgi:hypothetical protein
MIAIASMVPPFFDARIVETMLAVNAAPFAAVNDQLVPA